jgi:hypothetical protein
MSTSLFGALRNSLSRLTPSLKAASQHQDEQEFRMRCEHFSIRLRTWERASRACLAFVGIFWASVVHAICLNPFGCSPSTYEECVDDATNRPTDAGVRLARAQCEEKFKKPALERAAAEQKKLAERLAERWNQVGTMRNIADAKRAFGEPTRVDGPATCTQLSSADQRPAACLTYRWIDRRPGRVCVSAPPSQISFDCHFTLEVVAGSATLSIWATWPESF